MLVDLTDDGLRSGYAMTLIDPITSRVTGDAWFSGSFGPGQYHLSLVLISAEKGTTWVVRLSTAPGQSTE